MAGMFLRNLCPGLAPKHAWIILATTILSLAESSGCRDIANAEEAASVTTMRLSVGTQVVEVSESGEVSGGPIVIPVGSTAYSAELFDRDGFALRRPSDFRLEVTSTNTSTITVRERGNFTGSLQGERRGQTVISFQLWTRLNGGCHPWQRESGDYDVDVPVTVQ
jgi:hypothetical protein